MTTPREDGRPPRDDRDGRSRPDDGGEAPDGDELSAPVGAVLGPLPVWAGLALLGAIIGERLGIWLAPHVAEAGRTTWVTAGLGVVALVVVVVHLAGRGGVRSGVAGSVLVLVVVVLAAAGRVATTPLGLLPQLAAEGGRAEVELTVVTEPRPIGTGWHVTVAVSRVGDLITRERAAVTLDDDALDQAALGGAPPPLGSRWTTVTSARPLPDGGYGTWLARQHIAVVLDVGDLAPAGRPGLAARSTEVARERIRTAATTHLDDATGGLLIGLVTGDTRLLPDDERDAMQRTGLTHLTAVSGTHLAVLLAGVLGTASLLRLPARGRRAAVGLVVLWFAYLTRLQPSILRAGAMALLFLVLAERGVARDARHTLAGAVLLLVLIDPLLAGSLGLLLSASATAGILVLAPRIADRLHRLPRRLAEVSGITLGAQLAVLPLLVATFGEVEGGSVPANLLAVPAGVLAAAVAFVGSLVAQVHEAAGALVLWAAGWPARAVLWCAHRFAGVGGAVSAAVPASIVVAVAGGCWFVVPARGRASKGLAAVTAVACVVAVLPPTLGRVMPTSTFSVTAIDVGQGDAFLLRTPRARVLVDAGEGDEAARWLRRHGHVHLDVVIVTHGHLDHAGGMPEVLRSARVGAVWRPPSLEPIAAIEEVDATAVEAEVPVRVVTVGDAAHVGDLQLEVLGPPSGRPYRHARSEINEGSLVVRASFGEQRALFPGDAELAAQADLLAAHEAALAGGYDHLGADLLAVPHHGSATTDPAFLEAVAPQVAVIGVGEDNSHGHPHPRTIAALEAIGAEVRRTDREGTVTVPVPGVAAPTPSPIASSSFSIFSRERSLPPTARRRRRGRAPVSGVCDRG